MIWPTTMNPLFPTGHIYSFLQRCISVWSIKDISRRRQRHQTIFRLPSPQQPHSEHRFQAPSSLKEGCRKPVLGVCSATSHQSFRNQLGGSLHNLQPTSGTTLCPWIQLPVNILTLLTICCCCCCLSGTQAITKTTKTRANYAQGGPALKWKKMKRQSHNYQRI